jgi:hypothetical protein
MNEACKFCYRRGSPYNDSAGSKLAETKRHPKFGNKSLKNAGLEDFLSQPVQTTSHLFLPRVDLTGAVFAFFTVRGLSTTSISDPELMVDALRLPGCLLPTDDRSTSAGSSDREADLRVSDCDCCVGLCNRDDDAADWRDQTVDAGDMPRRAAAIACRAVGTPPASSFSSRRAEPSSASDIRVSAQSRAKTLSPPSASWNPRGFFSERTLSPVARAAKSSKESDALLRMPPSAGASPGALSPKLSTQSHGRFLTGDPGMVCPVES